MLGLIGIKEGMTQIFNDEGNIVPVTMIKIPDNIVINKRKSEKNGYNALIVGSIDTKEKNVIKPVKGQFKDIAFKKILKEFKVEDPDKYEVGQKIGLEIFDKVEFIDVVGRSKGKGFQGVVKRHHFHGGPKTHGSKFHRQNGSTGQSSFPSRTQKGLKRAGKMGDERITTQNLKITEIDIENNCILLRGCVPGKTKSIVYLTKAKKK